MARVTMPQRLQRLRNGSRMVAEVINNLNAACFSAHLLSSRDAGKAQFDFFETAKNISVIELDIIHHDQFGQVMDELRALVEKSRVVLVAFDHKIFGII